MQSLKQYYKDEKVLNEIISSVSHPQWRVWKALMTDGTFVQNRKKIKTASDLKEFLLQQDKTASKVYVSVAKFRQPEYCYGKRPKSARWMMTDSMFLGSELFFDFDSEDDLSIAHSDAKTVIKHMAKNEPDYKLNEIFYSGTRGFGLLYEDLNPIIEPNPLLRINKTEDKRLKLVDRLPELQTIDEHHKQIIADQFRVHAAIGTVKFKTGHKVAVIPKKCFMTYPTNQLIRKFIRRLVRPDKPMMVDEPILTSKAEGGTAGKKRPNLIFYPVYYHFVTNSIRGARNMYITVLKYPKDKKVAPLWDLMKMLQNEYNLSEFYKFVYDNVQMYINFKAVDKRRIEKIMRVAKPMNLNSFLFYGHTWIPISEAVDRKGNIVWSRPSLIGELASDYGLTSPHSRPHTALMDIKYHTLVGYSRNKICKAIIKEG